MYNGITDSYFNGSGSQRRIITKIPVSHRMNNGFVFRYRGRPHQRQYTTRECASNSRLTRERQFIFSGYIIVANGDRCRLNLIHQIPVNNYQISGNAYSATFNINRWQSFNTRQNWIVVYRQYSNVKQLIGYHIAQSIINIKTKVIN